jgi:16S rRNA (guanine966-N2)-methyltransferase
MSEKLRGAIFAALGDIVGLKVLDLYSGSGALGIEAISRGASIVLSIESDHRAAKTIMHNFSLLGISDEASVTNIRLESWLKREMALQHYDLILVDPPYDQIPTKKTLDTITTRLTDSGLLVLSWPGDLPLPKIKSVELIKSKSFNDAQVGFYRS